jgi:Arc/MetJ family transcription regulator
MIKRTTIEIDQELLARARQALGQPSARATVEAALRQAADQADAELEERARRQRRYLDDLDRHVDLDVLASDRMWR